MIACDGYAQSDSRCDRCGMPVESTSGKCLRMLNHDHQPDISVRYSCALCGAKVITGDHRCPKSVLAGIDGAHERALNDDLHPHNLGDEMRRPIGERMNQCEDDS